MIVDESTGEVLALPFRVIRLSEIVIEHYPGFSIVRQRYALETLGNPAQVYELDRKLRALERRIPGAQSCPPNFTNRSEE